MKPTPSRQEIESARRKMLETRQALEDHQNAKGYSSSSEYQKLYMEFEKAAHWYLKLSGAQGKP